MDVFGTTYVGAGPAPRATRPGPPWPDYEALFANLLCPPRRRVAECVAAATAGGGARALEVLATRELVPVEWLDGAPRFAARPEGQRTSVPFAERERPGPLDLRPHPAAALEAAALAASLHLLPGALAAAAEAAERLNPWAAQFDAPYGVALSAVEFGEGEDLSGYEEDEANDPLWALDVFLGEAVQEQTGRRHRSWQAFREGIAPWEAERNIEDVPPPQGPVSHVQRLLGVSCTGTYDPATAAAMRRLGVDAPEPRVRLREALGLRVGVTPSWSPGYDATDFAHALRTYPLLQASTMPHGWPLAERALQSARLSGRWLMLARAGATLPREVRGGGYLLEAPESLEGRPFSDVPNPFEPLARIAEVGLLWSLRMAQDERGREGPHVVVTVPF